MAARRMLRPSTPILFLVAVSLLNAGCYRYVEVDPGAVTPGADVRVRVTPTRASELENVLDQEDTREFGGVVMDGGSLGILRLSVPFQGVASGSASRGFNSLVDLEFLDVEDIRKREFDWARTGGLVGISAVITVAVLDAFFDPQDDTEGGIEPGDTEAAVIPLFSIRW